MQVQDITVFCPQQHHYKGNACDCRCGCCACGFACHDGSEAVTCPMGLWTVQVEEGLVHVCHVQQLPPKQRQYRCRRRDVVADAPTSVEETYVL